jgi:hypothetical protein
MRDSLVFLFVLLGIGGMLLQQSQCVVLAAMDSSTIDRPSSFAPRDFIATSVRCQQTGIGWKELGGDQCPSFGMRGHAWITIDANDTSTSTNKNEMRVQMGFDHGRFVTPWLKVTGRGAPPRPYIRVELTRSGSGIAGVRATVLNALRVREDVKVMDRMIKELYDSSVWPKHVFVQYVWKTRHETDVDAALVTVLGLGVLGTVVMAVRAMVSYRKHLVEFFSDVTADGDTASVGSGVEMSVKYQRRTVVGTPQPGVAMWGAPASSSGGGPKAD